MTLSAKRKIENYKAMIDGFYLFLEGVPEKYSSVKPAPDMWTLREIIGHLIDSASNNHQRFVRLQIHESLQFPGYDQETWIQKQRYDSFSWSTLKELWFSYNTLLLHIIENIDDKSLGNTWEFDGKKLSLDWIADDYFEHLKWHIKHFKERLGELVASTNIQHINPKGLSENPAFTQVIVVNNPGKTVYIGGQNAVDESGTIIGKGDITSQTEQVFKNLRTALQSAGAELENVVKWTIYVVQGQPSQPAIQVFQKVWGQRKNPPTISVLYVSGLAHPDFLLEIDAVAVVPGDQKSNLE